MGTIKVTVNGKPAFSWEGDESAIRNILEQFPVGARGVGMTPRALADNCVGHFLRKGKPLAKDQVGQEMQMMGVLWHILQAESSNAEHPGKIANYAGIVDFAVDLLPSPKGFSANITASGRFDS